MTTVVLVQQGGTGANSASGARDALGVIGSTGGTYTGNVNVAATLITQNVEPNANVTYNLGTSTKRFKDLWLSNSTIYLGEASISANGGKLVVPAMEMASGMDVGAGISDAHNQANSAYGLANLAYAAANNSNLKSGGLITGTLNVTNDVIVGGNIYLQGNTTYINVSTFNVNDPLIFLAANNNLTDSVDIGFMGSKNTSGVFSHTGFARDATDGKWKLFDGLVDAGHVGNVIDFANTSLATLVANVEANTLSVVNGVSGNVNFDSGTLFVDSVSNRVGVGVSSPTAQLDVAGTSSSGYSLLLRSGDVDVGTDSTQIAFSFNNGVNYRHSIRTRHSSSGASNNAIDFWLWNTADAATTLGSTRVMTIEGTGNVGIGTANPTSNLHIVGTANITSNVIVDGGTLFVNAVANNVGIGTTSPSTKLDVQGVVDTYNPDDTTWNFNAAHKILTVRSGDNFFGSEQGIEFAYRSEGVNASIWAKGWGSNYNSGRLTFLTRTSGSLTQKMTIDESGNVGIGTTSPVARLNVEVAANNGAIIALAGNANGFYPSAIFGGAIGYNFSAGGAEVDIWNTWTGASSTQGGFAFRKQTGASSQTQLMLIRGDGNVGIGNTAPASKLTVAGVIESTTGGIKFPDGTTQTTAPVAATGTPSMNLVSGTAVTAIKENHYILINASATTITLPASPSAGDVVWVTIANGRVDNIIARNGRNINSLAEDMTVDVGYIGIQLRYADATRGWVFST